MTATDPLRTLWDALDRRGCEPRGVGWDFRARCPAHDGGSPDALHVSIGADGRALLWCFAYQCAAERIVAALELTISDLFPAGHRRARRLEIEQVRPSESTGNAGVVANTVAALAALGVGWQASVSTECAYCGETRALLHVRSEGRPWLDCWSGCTAEMFKQALAKKLARKLSDLDESDLIARFATLQPPPPIVAQNLLADPEAPLPVLERVVEVPVLAPDGTVHELPGYDASSRCFHAPAHGLNVPPVSARPSSAETARAKELIVDELLGDSPFVSDAERAAAIGFLLEPFVRVLIDGSTPLYLFEAPTPGTGKTLLVEALTVPTLGSRRLTLMAEARDADEWRKRLTAKLRNAPPFLVIDNLRRPLDAGALAMMLTAGVVEDRLLGVSETVTLPARCTIAATANNRP